VLVARDIDRVIRQAVAWGYQCRRTTDGLLFVNEDRSVGLVAAHLTPSDRRATRNLLADLRRGVRARVEAAATADRAARRARRQARARTRQAREAEALRAGLADDGDRGGAGHDVHIDDGEGCRPEATSRQLEVVQARRRAPSEPWGAWKRRMRRNGDRRNREELRRAWQSQRS